MDHRKDMPSYDAIPDKPVVEIQLTPYGGSKFFKIIKTKRPIHDCYVLPSGDIVADRKFINLTSLIDVFIIDGATGKRVYSSSRGSYSHEHEFRIIASISDLAEAQRISIDGCKNNVLRDTVEYVITEETLRKTPVYIPQLNIKIVAGKYANTEGIPDVERDMNVYREYIQNQAQLYYDRPAYAPYMLLPMSYTGSKEFYMAINDVVCLLPILVVDDTILPKPKLIVKWRDSIDKIVKDIEVEVDPIALLKTPQISIEGTTCLLSTNRRVVQSILDDRLAQSAHTETLITHLKHQITALVQDKKILEEEITRFKADQAVYKFYSECTHEENIQRSKERIENIKEESAKRKDTGETIKVVLTTVAGLVTLVGVVVKLAQMLADVKSK